MKKSTSFDQNKIKIICDQLCDDIEDLLDSLELEYKMNHRFVSMSCPIHGGDNDSAVNIYHVGDTYRGNWKCRTHRCEETFKSSIIGFIRGVISNRKYNWNKTGDTTCSFKEALEYATKFLDVEINKIKLPKHYKDKNTFINNAKIFTKSTNSHKYSITKDLIRKSLNIPSKYFIDRGFSCDILDKYDVGDCHNASKEMYNRAVVPVYDIENRYMVGCTGRSFFEKCSECKCYHDGNCPKKEYLWKYSKWKHSNGFKTQEHLYNFWYAKDYITETGSVIIVESPGNVWKLEECGIHNSVAIFGTNLTDRQKTILDMSGAMNIIAIMDNDEAGIKAAENIKNKCNKTYNIRNITISKNDVADMTINEIEQEIKAFI
jgi:5S rRNA maturation endonuclease (ribonuclease M5)